MASFAKAQLLKFGWTEGKGLGKNENGIVEALKPKLKFDNTGIGHDAKEYKWWESVYEKASKNIKIRATEKDGGELRVTAKKPNSLKISTSQFALENSGERSDLRYGNFLKTCTLDNGKVRRDEKVALAEEEIKLGEVLTDEQLFEACGGRTAHKGARHGLKLSGKLARIARQEAELLGSREGVDSLEEKKEETLGEWKPAKSKKNKKRKREKSPGIETIDLESLESADCTDSNANFLSQSSESVQQTSKKSKKCKKKEKRRLQELASKLDSIAIDDKEEEIESEEIITINLEDEEEVVEKKTKFTETECANFRIEKKKKKSLIKKEKKRLENLSESLMAVNLSENLVQSERLSEELTAKLKKKRKKKKDIGKLKKSKSL